MTPDTNCSSMPRGLLKRPTVERESELRKLGYALVAGVDEAGRGPLAGPVAAAAVVIPPGWHDPGLNDSKRLTACKRRQFYKIIRLSCQSAIGLVQAWEIDRINIHRASLLAMRRAVETLPSRPHYLLIDGKFLLDLDLPQEARIKGDSTFLAVAAAGIVAKVCRDEIMAAWHVRYPHYNFAAHKGYGTSEHLAALAKYGPCPIHRQSYAPVRNCKPGESRFLFKT